MKKIVLILIISFFSKNLFSSTNNKETSRNIFEQYTLTINVSNGFVTKLIANEETDKLSFEDGEIVRLVTRPAFGYKFSHWEGDASGNRLITDVVITGNINVTAVFEKWIPATGTPAPEFGVFETYRMYDNVENRNSELTYNQNAEGGYYTHYIDNTAINATDSDNKYGSEEKPRISLPSASDTPAGSVIEYHGTSYTRGHTVLKLTGTAEKPIFIRGASVDEPIEINSSAFYLNSEYVIMENLKMSLTVRSYEEKIAHHVAIRNFHATNLSAVSYIDGVAAENVVFYGNYVNRNQFDPDDGDFEEDDGMGIGINGRSDSVWIIDNIITRAGGDAVGNGHAANYTAKNYYVGRNIMYTCGENAVDIKEVDKVIVSENIMFDYEGWSSGSNGAAVVMHYGPNVSPKNVWVINNEIFECTSTGIQVGGDQVYDVYLVGNLIHDVHNETNTANAYISWSSQKVYMINNTFYNVDNGINSNVDNSNAALYATNNIISKVSEGGYHISIGGSTNMSNSILDNNLYYQPDGVATLDWGSNSYTLDEFIENTAQGEGSIEAAPLFVNPEEIDFSLQSNSPAIDAGIEHTIYQLYENLYGLSIKYDANGVIKPNGESWDIGAYEFNFNSSEPIDNETTIDRDELRMLITSSQNTIDSSTMGNAEGEYAQTVVDNATSAVVTAEEILANGTTQNEIDQAVVALVEAMELFIPNNSSIVFYMYPNPVVDILVLENISDINYISIFDASGSKIKSLSIQDNSLNIDLSDLSTGVYYINLYTLSEVISKTILKE